MPEGSSAPDIKVSKNPAIQSQVDQRAQELRSSPRFANRPPELINEKARSEVAHSLWRDKLRSILGKKAEDAEQRAQTAEANSMIDPLTKLHNRRWFDEELPRRMAEARRQGKSIWAVMADIDHFKGVNDTHGHAIGDKVLQEMAAVSARLEEPLVRLGGEEFGQALQDGHSPKQLQIIFSRFSNEFGENTEKMLGNKATVSYGVARMEDGDTPESLMEKADKALYNSKSSGRDKVSVFGGNIENPQYQELPILPPNQLATAQVGS
jgi:diguanylate cyclase (GGDEF)-like protein